MKVREHMKTEFDADLHKLLNAHDENEAKRESEALAQEAKEKAFLAAFEKWKKEVAEPAFDHLAFHIEARRHRVQVDPGGPSISITIIPRKFTQLPQQTQEFPSVTFTALPQEERVRAVECARMPGVPDRSEQHATLHLEELTTDRLGGFVLGALQRSGFGE